MFKKLLLITLLLSTSIFSVISKADETFTVSSGGTAYEIGYKVTSYTTGSALLTAQPWWGNSSLAINLSSLLADNLPAPAGPGNALFAYGLSGSSVSMVFWRGSIIDCSPSCPGVNDNYGYAYVVGPSIRLADLAQSVAANTQVPLQVSNLTGMTLNGAHHRTLMDMPMADEQQCAWATGDIGRLYRQGNGYVSSAEVGACRDFSERSLRAGIALGETYSKQDQVFNGKSQMNGQYVLGELDWAIPDTPFVASALGMYNRWNAYVTRGYATLGTVASDGKTNIDAYTLRTRLDWKNAFQIGQVGFTPIVAFTLSKINVDGYAETGGTAPATFGDHSTISKEIRGALSGAYQLSDATELRGNLEVVHRFDSNSGTVVVASLFGITNVGTTIAGNDTRQNWVRVGGEVSHRINEHSLINASTNYATAGQDADISAALSYQYLF